MKNLRSSLGGNRIAHLRDLLRVLVVRDLKVRYKRSVLGMLWTLVNPLRSDSRRGPLASLMSSQPPAMVQPNT